MKKIKKIIHQKFSLVIIAKFFLDIYIYIMFLQTNFL